MPATVQAAATLPDLPIRWEAGQHVAVIGMTGSGKSVLASRLLEPRRYVVVIRSKSDRTKYPQTVTSRSAAILEDPRVSRVVLSPQWESQPREFHAALERVWKQGGWTVYVDELHYVDGELKLRDPINRILTQGRDPGRISMMCGMQRPTQVTRFAIGEATHVISFGLEGRDVLIMRDAAGPSFAALLPRLPRHHFAWLHRPTRRVWTGKLDLSSGGFAGSFVRS